MTQLNNIKPLKRNRKNLRNNLTSAEAFLWNLLKNSQLDGRKFRRQHSFGSYIMDFYCAPEKLGIELDGAQHYTTDGLEYDKVRTEYLTAHGIRIIRFENKVVFENTEFVLDEIRKMFITTPVRHE